MEEKRRVWALIKDGIVINRCIWNGIVEWTPGDDITLVEITDDETKLQMGEPYEEKKGK